MLNLQNSQFRVDPYPMGLATNVFDETVYAEMVDNFPNVKAAAKMGLAYNKFSLSERNNSKTYHVLIDRMPIWSRFYNYIKSVDFLLEVDKALASNIINWNIGQNLSSRFEFSWLPANGGFITPHRDIKSKVLTLILPMVKPGEWNPIWGGGTDMLEPLRLSQWSDATGELQYADYKISVCEFKKVATYPYEPNRCTIFVKTDNSWHSVGPIGGPDGLMRKTLTVNIEAT